MSEKGICLICGERFEREEKTDGRKKLGCGDCGENPKQMAKSMFLFKTPENPSLDFIDKGANE